MHHLALVRNEGSLREEPQKTKGGVCASVPSSAERKPTTHTENEKLGKHWAGTQQALSEW